VNKYYFLNLVNYDKGAVDRVSLLFNIKQMVEEKIESRQYDKHYRVQYDANVAVTMMYVFFMNEFRGLLMDEKSLLQLRCRKDGGGGGGDIDKNQVDEIDYKIGLVGSLYGLLVDQLDEEFKGYALIDIQPMVGDATSTTNIPPITECISKRYTTVTIPNQRTIYTVKDTSSGDTVVKEKECSHLRYTSMRMNRVHYEFITRRFIFDHALACVHNGYCSCGSGSGSSSGDKNIPLCHICIYFSENLAFKTFYEMSESLPYNICHYTHFHNKELDNETKLVAYLGTLVIDPILSLDSIIYKNAWQVLTLFYGGISGKSPMVGEDSRIFHMICLGDMMNRIKEMYDSLDGGAEIRTNRLITMVRNNQKSFHHIEKWQKRFVSDIDMMYLMLNAIILQKNEIDKYERTISPTLLVVSTDYKIKESVISELSKLYQFSYDEFNKFLLGV
jgi:hypothetical protein